MKQGSLIYGMHSYSSQDFTESEDIIASMFYPNWPLLNNIGELLVEQVQSFTLWNSETGGLQDWLYS